MVWKLRSSELSLESPRVMGILNVTPDSFSDGGSFVAVDDAVAAAIVMHEQGAAIIDVGGESTRPGAEPVDAAEQIRRVVPVIEKLRSQRDVLISIDTTRSVVASAAIEAGAQIVNDISAGTDDAAMFELAASTGCGLVLMHRLVAPAEDRYSDRYVAPPTYDNVTAEVRAFLEHRCDAAVGQGVERAQLVIDPGLGFGKTVTQNYELIAQMHGLSEIAPVLCAASRKSFIGRVSGVDRPRDRVAGSVAVTVDCFRSGVRLFRVHDVAAHCQALAVAEAIANTRR